MKPTRSGGTLEDPVSRLEGISRTVVLKELERVASECGRLDWDGEGGVAVSPAAVQHARHFVSALDFTPTPLPEAISEPDGDLALEWHQDESHWLILSFAPDGAISYAWKSGDMERATGTSTATPEFMKLVQSYLSTLVAVADAGR